MDKSVVERFLWTTMYMSTATTVFRVTQQQQLYDTAIPYQYECIFANYILHRIYIHKKDAIC